MVIILDQGILHIIISTVYKSFKNYSMPHKSFIVVPTFLEAEKYIPGIQNVFTQILQKKYLLKY